MSNIHKHLKKKYSPYFLELVRDYSINAPQVHKQIWENFYDLTNSIDYLRKHRDYIEKFDFGFGDRPFHYMWRVLVNEMPKRFKFLEIGVYKGQTISLIQLLSKKMNKNVKIYGVTPLTNAGDKYSNHPNIDYLEAIKRIYKDFDLPFEQTTIVKGFSQDPAIIKEVSKEKPFDMVFIDGCHDYKVVASDIENYGKLIKKRGFLVIDDSAYYLKLPKYVNKGSGILSKFLPIVYRTEMFKGFPEVARAVRNELDNNHDFLHIFSCGHDRIWMRV